MLSLLKPSLQALLAFELLRSCYLLLRLLFDFLLVLARDPTLLDPLDHNKFVLVRVLHLLVIEIASLLLILISVSFALVLVLLFLFLAHLSPVLLDQLHYLF